MLRTLAARISLIFAAVVVAAVGLPTHVAMAENLPKKRARKFKVKPGILLQAWLAYHGESGDVLATIPGARIKLRAGMKGLFMAKLAVGFGDFEVELKDAFVNVNAYGRSLQVRTGYFKLPFSRERLTPGAWTGGVERTVIRTAFGQGRDIGLMLHNGLTSEDGFEWALGLFSDFEIKEFDPAVGPLDIRPTLALRIGYNMAGLKGYRETDATRGPLRVGGGFSALAFLENGASAPGRRGYRWNVDAIAKIEGFTLAAAGYGHMSAVDSLSHEALGAYAHVGYRLDRVRDLEFALRYGGLFPDVAPTEQEIMAGISAFFFDDHLIVRTDAGIVITDTEDFVFRFQMQVR